MRKNNKILADDVTNHNSAIIGRFSGECADSNITNLNGLDITREVWEHVFASEDYKKAIELGHYIGFLGHPSDVNCMNFKDACIVMTEGHIADNGKVYGEFNLIDTPVGRIVKSFIDAGVTFGISVRGAGDIIHNSVDPETFVFRGFDLVAFPAFPESIPKFIAASADGQQKYKSICASVKSNLKDITSCSTLHTLSHQFAQLSDVYEDIQNRIAELSEESTDSGELPDNPAAEEVLQDDDESICQAVAQEKIDALTKLYVEQLRRSKELEAQLKAQTVQCARKLSTMNRLVNEQIRSAVSARYKAEYDKTSAITAHKQTIEKLKSSIAAEKDEFASYRKSANREISDIKKRITSAKELNLKYLQKIRANESDIKSKDELISSLKNQLHETVTASEKLKRGQSNLDAELNSYRDKISECRRMLTEYQKAYSELYSQAVGADSKNIKITASTDVSSLKAAVRESIKYNPVVRDEPTEADIEDMQDIDYSDYSDSDIVSM